jgi:hypothetical protein
MAASARGVTPENCGLKETQTGEQLVKTRIKNAGNQALTDQ